MAQFISDSPDTTTSRSGVIAKRRIHPLLVIPVALVLLGGGVAAWYGFSRPSNDALTLSGRIEGYETDIGAKVGGRVNFVAVREGDAVRKGQVIARLDDDEIQAQLRGAEARLVAARQQVQSAQSQVDIIESQIRESQLNVQQSQQAQVGQVFQAEANVATAEAQLKQAQAQLNLARINRDRFALLVKQGAVEQQRYDQALTTYETALATTEANQRQVQAAKGALALARSTQLNPSIRTAQLTALLRQRDRALAQLRSAEADVKNALAARQQVQAQLAYLNVASPIDGVVTTRSVEPGAVVAAGKTLLSVVDLNTVYLRGFIPEGEIGKIRVGQPARVYLDSAPDKPLSAKVASTDPQASFTPENIYFQKDRVRQVFGVKLTIDQPGGFAKPGMPADAEIIVEPETR